MKHSFLFLSCIVISGFLEAQSARIQFIHNSADVLTPSIDIYSSDTLLVDNLDFRSATVFMSINTTTDIEIALADSSSQNSSEAFFSTTISLAPDAAYLLLIEGILSTSGYDPAPTFGIKIFDNARELGTELTGTDILFYNGATDAPAIDILEDELLLLTAYEDLDQGTFSGYISLPAADYHLKIDNADEALTYTSGHASLGTLGLGGQAVTILTSGFLQPDSNSNGPSFGLWMARAEGGPMTGLTGEPAFFQFIHNSADESNEVVDVYWNGVKIADDLAYHHATPYLAVPAGVEINFAIAPAESITADDPLTTFNAGVFNSFSYHLGVLNGMSTADNFNPALPLTLTVYNDSRIVALEGSNTDVLFVQGSTDSPLLDVAESEFINMTVLENVAYNEFNGYFEFPTVNAQFEVLESVTQQSLGEYEAPFLNAGFQGRAITVVAGGFMYPGQNNEGQSFGLWIAESTGGPMIPLDVIITPVVNANVQFIHNSADAMLSSVDIYLDQTLLIDNLDFRSASPFTEITLGMNNEISITPADAENVTEAFASFFPGLEANTNYILILSGIVSGSGYNPSPPLELSVLTGVLTEAGNENDIELLIHQGSTDLPSVDLEFSPVSNTISLNGFSSTSEYISLDSNIDYGLHIESQFGNISLGDYAFQPAALELNGLAAIVFAGGYLNPVNNSNGAALEWWCALPDGTTFLLPGYTGMDLSAVSGIVLYPNPATSHIRIEGVTSTVNTIELIDVQGRQVKSLQSITGTANCFDISSVENGCYFFHCFSANNEYMIPFIKSTE